MLSSSQRTPILWTRIGTGIVGLAGLFGGFIACVEGELNPARPRQTTPTDDGADGINGTGVGAGTGANTGLPCDVQQLLENRCIGCHLAGAISPPPLLTYEDLVKPSTADPTKSIAQRCLDRMRDTSRPMPPAPAVAPTPEEIATLQGWMDAKTPRGVACTGADGGAPSPSSSSTSYNTPSVCTSNKTWQSGADTNSSMRPGEPCITCHSRKGGPAYSVAGTVYPTAHEPNDCNGVAGQLQVVVTGADNVVTTIQVNSVGNFMQRTKIVPPFHVKVTNGTKERVMATALTAGDCNTCHTEQGVNGAPGRVMAP